MTDPLNLQYPFEGRWLVQNSPANRVPSHGTTRFATSYAIDFVPVDDDGGTAPIRFGSLFCPEPPERFPGFGRMLVAPLAGTVVAVHDSEPDHAAYRGLPSIAYALTQRGRLHTGWAGLAGNHVLIQAEAAVIALCHLQQGSLAVRSGQRVTAGEVIARCGNSGNSTEPHVHLQAVDSLEIERAHALPITFNGSLPRNGTVIER